MKKLLVLVVALLLTFTLAGCTTEETYTKEEVDLILKDYESEILQQQEDIIELEEREGLNNNMISILSQQIEELQPSQTMRFFEWAIGGDDFIFVEFGETYSGTIGYWDYYEYIIEVEETTTIIIHLSVNGSVDINYYLENYMTYDDYWSCNQSECTYEITVQQGYSVFEAENMDENGDDVYHSIWFEEVE